MRESFGIDIPGKDVSSCILFIRDAVKLWKSLVKRISMVIMTMGLLDEIIF